MASADSNRPIIVKKIKRGGEGAHGGAWKVAFADFMTSMTALFLVLYLIESTTPAEKMAISMYFTSPTGFTDGGSPFVIDLEGGMRNTDSIDKVSSPAPPTQTPDTMPDVNIDRDESKKRANKRAKEVGESVELSKEDQKAHREKEDDKFKKLKAQMEQTIQANPTLRALKDQIIISLTDDGLQIQIVDKKKRPMFDSGKASVKPHMSVLLKEITRVLKDVPNKVSIAGHTDSVPFTEEPDYTNWELSADRANAARRALLGAGLDPKKVARVVGLADSDHFIKDKPDDPMNRRTTLLIMRTLADVPKRPEGLDGDVPTTEIRGGEPVVPPTQAAEEAAKPAPVDAVEQATGLDVNDRAALPEDEDFPSVIPPLDSPPTENPVLPGETPAGDTPAAGTPAAAPVMEPFEFDLPAGEARTSPVEGQSAPVLSNGMSTLEDLLAPVQGEAPDRTVPGERQAQEEFF